MLDRVTIIHRNGDGSHDYLINLTFEYGEESGQWVGVCLELGTSAFGDTLDQLRTELREAVELQLNEVERLGFIREFLEDNRVSTVQIGPNTTPREPGFAVANSLR